MKEFFVLVEVPKYLPWNLQPRIGEYTNPHLKKVTPCTLEGDRYVSWETGEEVEVGEDTKIWRLFSGTCFRLKNRKEILISRRRGKEFLTTDFRFNPLSMVRYEAK